MVGQAYKGSYEAFNVLFDRCGISYDFSAGCVPIGWHSLLERLIQELQENGWDGKLDQMKAKFGGLRFYISTYEKNLQDIIYKYEAESFKICQMCGVGVTTPPERFAVLCPEHSKGLPNA